MISYAEGRTSDLVGLSTDTKPTDGILTNTLFIELDTGKVKYFDGTEWKDFGGNGGE